MDRHQTDAAEQATRRSACKRRVLNGIFWVLRSGAPWRELPKNYGPYTTCYNRRRAGVWDQIMGALTAAHDAAVQMIDTCESISMELVSRTTNNSTWAGHEAG